MALDEADIKRINELMAEAVKAAMAPDALGKILGPAVESHVKAATKGAVTEDALKAALAEFAKTVKPADDEKKDDGKGKAKDGESEALAAMRKQMDELKASTEAANRARIDAERKAVADANRAKLKDALVAAGIDARAMHIVVPAIEASGQVTFDGDVVGWKGKDTYGAEKVLDYVEGAKAWASTDDGKRFLPASGAQGTGDGASKNNGSGHAGASAIRNADGSLNLAALASKVYAAT